MEGRGDCIIYRWTVRTMDRERSFSLEDSETAIPKVVILETNELFSRGDASVIAMPRNPRRSLHGRSQSLKYHRFWKMEPADPKLQTTIFNGFGLRAAVAPYTGGSYMHATDDRTPSVTLSQGIIWIRSSVCVMHETKLLFSDSPFPGQSYDAAAQ